MADISGLLFVQVDELGRPIGLQAAGPDDKIPSGNIPSGVIGEQGPQGFQGDLGNQGSQGASGSGDQGCAADLQRGLGNAGEDPRS